jgi:hypothetical protein
VTTNGVRGHVRAVADGTGPTRVTAELGVGGPLSNLFLSLDGDDRLLAGAGGKQQPMVRRNDVFGRVWYEALLEPGPADGEIVVSLVRTLDQGAPDTRLSLPPAFRITAPARDASFSRANQDLALRWEPASGSEPMVVTLEGGCIETFARTVEVDRGELIVPRGTLAPPAVPMQPVEAQGPAPAVALPAELPPPECRVRAVFTRQRVGRIDPRFGQGGHAVAEQTRATEFVSVP